MKVQLVTKGGIVERDATPEELAQRDIDIADSGREKSNEKSRKTDMDNSLKDGAGEVTRKEMNDLKRQLRKLFL